LFLWVLCVGRYTSLRWVDQNFRREYSVSVYVIVWVDGLVWVHTRLYYCIISNNTILYLQCVGRRSQNKKERNLQSGNKALSVYINIGVGNSED
jgi:hypothetical protein